MSKSISDLRDILFATLEGLKSGPVDVDKARQMNEVAKTLVETAKVEVDFLRVTGGDKSVFLTHEAGEGGAGSTTGNTPPPPAALPNGIKGITRHILEG